LNKWEEEDEMNFKKVHLRFKNKDRKILWQ
jgi:hypothetical protein